LDVEHLFYLSEQLLLFEKISMMVSDNDSRVVLGNSIRFFTVDASAPVGK
jgi:hypothetical protein